MLNFGLTPEQLEIQKRAREFALKEILPVALSNPYIAAPSRW